jgi:hypothetical protein
MTAASRYCHLWRVDLAGDRLIRSDLPQDIASEYNVEQQEQQEMLEFFHKQLQFALVHSIKQAISDRITYLKKSKGYAAFAERNKDLII